MPLSTNIGASSDRMNAASLAIRSVGELQPLRRSDVEVGKSYGQVAEGGSLAISDLVENCDASWCEVQMHFAPISEAVAPLYQPVTLQAVAQSRGGGLHDTQLGGDLADPLWSSRIEQLQNPVLRQRELRLKAGEGTNGHCHDHADQRKQSLNDAIVAVLSAMDVVWLLTRRRCHSSAFARPGARRDRVVRGAGTGTGRTSGWSGSL
ncbi:hypothetical protein ACWEH1_19170 [Micromonospora chersina]